jgi:hypothetical protein
MRLAFRRTAVVFAFSLLMLVAGGSPASAAVSNDPNYTASLLTSGLSGPDNGVLFRPATNDVLVSEFFGGKVTSVNASSGAKAPFASVPSPDEMAIDSLGDVYVKEHPKGPIFRFSAAGTPLVPASFSASCLPFKDPTGMAFDAADNFYVACSGTPPLEERIEGEILKFAAGTFTSPTEFARGFPSLEGMRFNSAGKLFVTDFVNGRIYEVKPGGTTQAEHTLWASGLTSPLNVAFDPCSGVPSHRIPQRLCESHRRERSRRSQVVSAPPLLWTSIPPDTSTWTTFRPESCGSSAPKRYAASVRRATTTTTTAAATTTKTTVKGPRASSR